MSCDCCMGTDCQDACNRGYCYAEAERERQYYEEMMAQAEAEQQPCAGCGDPDCDFNCDGDYDV